MTEGNEQISALMDDDYDHQSLNQLLRDEELQHTWARYHLIGDCLRDSLPEQMDTGLANRIHAQLASEPTVLAPAGNKHSHLKPLAGFAIAASVALVAVFGIRQNTDSVVPMTNQPAIAANQAVQPVQSASSGDTYTFTEPQVRPASIQTDTPASMASQRMSGYLVNHNQYRSSNGMHGSLPYVRIITIDTQE